MKTTAWPMLALSAALLAPAAFAATHSHPAKPAAAKPAPAAKTSTDVVTDVPPPSGTWEGTPPPAQGYVWSTGYYEWRDGHYQWKKGEWVLAKEGMDYRQHQWTQKGDGRWHLVGGDWVAPGHQVAGK